MSPISSTVSTPPQIGTFISHIKWQKFLELVTFLYKIKLLKPLSKRWYLYYAQRKCNKNCAIFKKEKEKQRAVGRREPLELQNHKIKIISLSLSHSLWHTHRHTHSLSLILKYRVNLGVQRESIHFKVVV